MLPCVDVGIIRSLFAPDVVCPVGKTKSNALLLRPLVSILHLFPEGSRVKFATSWTASRRDTRAGECID